MGALLRRKLSRELLREPGPSKRAKVYPPSKKQRNNNNNRMWFKLLLLCVLALVPKESPASDVHQIPVLERAASDVPQLPVRTRSSLSTEDLLAHYNLRNKRMVRDNTVRPTTDTIEWTQHARCWWECKEEFYLVDYYEDGDLKNNVYKVFVAKEVGIPNSFNTAGYKNELNMGFFDFPTEGLATMVFVIQPSDWKIYQHRFKTQEINKFVAKIGGALIATGATSLVAAAGIGASLGSVVPGAGTALGAAIGAAAGFTFNAIQDDYFGDFLRHIG